jgi:hypothetical protein
MGWGEAWTFQSKLRNEWLFYLSVVFLLRQAKKGEEIQTHCFNLIECEDEDQRDGLG